MKRFLWAIGIGILVFGISYWIMEREITSALIAIIIGSLSGFLIQANWINFGIFARSEAKKTVLPTKENLWDGMEKAGKEMSIVLGYIGKVLLWVGQYLILGPFVTVGYLFSFNDLKNEKNLHELWTVLLILSPAFLVGWEVHVVGQAFTSVIDSVPALLVICLAVWKIAAIVVIIACAVLGIAFIVAAYLIANDLWNPSYSDPEPTNSAFDYFFTGWMSSDHNRSILGYVLYVYKIRSINVLRLFLWIIKITLWLPCKIASFKAGMAGLTVAVFSAIHILLGFKFGWMSGLDYWLSLVVVDLVAIAFGRMIYLKVENFRWEMPKLIELEHEPLKN